MARYFTEDHEWVEVNGNTATVGITKHAADELGEVVYVDLCDVDESFTKGDEFASVESVKTVSGIYAPISGTVTEVNSTLDSSPESLNSDPEGKSWLVKFSVESADDLEGLMTAEEYQASIA